MGAVGKIEQLQGRESEWHPLAELTAAGKRAAACRRWPRCRSWAGARKRSAPGDVLGALTGGPGLHARAGRQDRRQRVLDLRGGGSRVGQEAAGS